MEQQGGKDDDQMQERNMWELRKHLELIKWRARGRELRKRMWGSNAAGGKKTWLAQDKRAQELDTQTEEQIADAEKWMGQK